MILPAPIGTAHQIEYDVTISNSSRKVNNLCMPYFRTNYSNMRYDVFLGDIAKKEIKGLCMTTNQRAADIILKDGSHSTIYFPENYDIVSYLLVNDVPVELREEINKPSIIDIISLMIQVALFRLFTNIFSINNTSRTFENFMVRLLNSDFHGSIQYLYSYAKTFSKEDIEAMMRVINCRIYINKRQFRKIIKLLN
jgi:hypothetical protein